MRSVQVYVSSLKSQAWQTSDLKLETCGIYLIGTRCFSSSNQFKTALTYWTARG